jgi:CRISPR-associated endonuclease/helicase Cas3
MRLIAKKSRQDSSEVDLYTHIFDAAKKAESIYDKWLAPGLKTLLPSRELCVFLAAAHDLGKASPVFQAHLDRKGKNEPRHWNISYEILRRANYDRRICAVLASHHGVPPDDRMLNELKEGVYDERCGFNTRSDFCKAQKDLLAYTQKLSGLDLLTENIKPLEKYQQMLLAGFVIICDWIASADTDTFPEPWFVMSNNWEDLYRRRFSIKKPYPMQEAVIKSIKASADPGLLIIEAPMGEGKTEAALAAAEMMAERSRRGGLFFALPTQATSNAMFSRILAWTKALGLNEPHTIDLLHGKKAANERYRELLVYGESEGALEPGVVVHEWLKGRKKAIFADFLIGTVDHLLMMALKQKHVMLRHLGIANKVVIIDEVHAYDAYMDTYLCRVLNWLGVYRVPVILLSATLTKTKRSELLNAYLNEQEQSIERAELSNGTSKRVITSRKISDFYPLITYTDGKIVYEMPVTASSRRIDVRIKFVTDEEMLNELSKKLTDGGVAGIIVNTVKRAQQLYSLLKEQGESVLLFHSRFTAAERVAIEKRVLDDLGKDSKHRPNRLVIVGTQVLEQSLDIDFDILVSDLAPMDLLIQRIGRLHRHEWPRPGRLQNAICMVTEQDDSEKIYGAYLLKRTQMLLPDILTLPDSISPLVNMTYDGSDGEGKEDYDRELKKKQNRAETFRLVGPLKGRPLIVNLLDKPIGDGDKHGNAAVRDGNDALEVVMIYDSELGQAFDFNYYNLIKRNIKLPMIFSQPFLIDRTIEELEKNFRNQQGDLFLVLDKNGETELCGYRLTYTKERGLEYEKI